MFLPYEKMWDMPLQSAAERGVEPQEGEKHITHWAGNILYVVLAALCKVLFRYNVIGRENLRQFAGKGGCIVASNHASYFDPVFIWLAGRPKQWIRFMARENMFGNVHGLGGQVISRVGAFPIKRDSADRSAIKRASAMLKRGECVGIFPEGTRRGKGTAAPALHSGVAFIARMGGKAPIIPSTIRNVDKIKQKGERAHFPKVTVVYGEPVFLEDFDFLPKEDRLDAVSWYVMRECYALLRNVRREEVDMKELFPDAKDFSEVLNGHDFSHKGA